MTRLVGFLDLAIPGMTTLADKGFVSSTQLWIRCPPSFCVGVSPVDD